MVGTIVTIVSYVLLVLVAGIAFWVGYKRGVKRSLIVTGVTLGLLIVAYFVTPFISKAILQIQINLNGSAKPLSQIIIDAFSSSDSARTAIENSPTLKAFLEALPGVIVSVVVFFVMYGVVRLFGYIIYKIVEKTALKSKQEEKELGLKRNKWAGAGINTAKALVFMFIVFAPLTALMGFVSDIKNQTESQYSESSTEETSASIQMVSPSFNDLPSIDDIFEKVPAVALEGVNSYNSSVLGVVGGFLGIDNLIFDGLTKIEVDGEKIYFRQDALEYVTVYNTFRDVKKALDTSTSTTIFKNINWDSFDKIADKLINSGLVKGLASNLAADVINNYENFASFNIGEFTEIFEAVRTSLQDANVKEYFSNDIKAIYNCVSIAGRSGLLDAIYQNREDTKEMVYAVLDEDCKAAVLKIVDNILNMNVVKNATSPVVKLALEKTGTTEIALADNATASWTNFKTDVVTIVEKAIDLSSEIDIFDTIEKPISLLNISEEKVLKVTADAGILLDKANTLVKSGESGIVEKLLSNYEIENVLSVKNDDGTQNTNIASYKTLMEYLATPIKNIVKLDIYEQIKDGVEDAKVLVKAIASKLTSGQLENIFLPLYKVDILRERIFSHIVDGISGNGIFDLSELEVTEIPAGETEPVLNFEKSYANWANDSKQLNDLLIALNTIRIDDGGDDVSLLEKVLATETPDFTEILQDINNEQMASVIKPIVLALSTRSLLSDIFDRIVDTLNDTAGTEATINLNVEQSVFVEQADELTDILVCAVNLYKISGSSGLSFGEIAELLDAIKTNAEREDGIFKSVYVAIENVANVVEALNDAIENVPFVADIIDLIGSEENITVDTITEIIGNIEEDLTEEQVVQITELIETVSESELVTEILPDNIGEIIANHEEQILDAIRNDLNEETKQKIQELLEIFKNSNTEE